MNKELIERECKGVTTSINGTLHYANVITSILFHDVWRIEIKNKNISIGIQRNR